TTRALIPVSRSSAGNKCAKRPDCSVDVVDATTIYLSCAFECDKPMKRTTPPSTPTNARRFIGALLGDKSQLPRNVANEKTNLQTSVPRCGPRAGTRYRRQGAWLARGCASS